MCRPFASVYDRDDLDFNEVFFNDVRVPVNNLVDGLRDKVLTAPYNPYAPNLFTAGWFARYISTYAGTIAGGTSEIQRNIIAQRVLGLPSR